MTTERICDALMRENLKSWVFTKIDKDFLDKNFPVTIQSSTAVGIEIELEGFRSAKHPDAETALAEHIRRITEHQWLQHEDGSLRNHGREFVTPAGLTVAQASQFLPLLQRYLELFYTRVRASGRCGVHIHVNCLNLTYAQVAAFAALYTVVEKSLFRYTGDRVDNNFCVPVRFSQNLVSNLIRAGLSNNRQAFWAAAQRSPKYLAFNIGALQRFGTIELRHAKGTHQPTTILPWLEVVDALFTYANAHDPQMLINRLTDLNTNSEYDRLIQEMFPREFVHTTGLDFIRQDMINGCSTLKEYLIPPELVREELPQPQPRRNRDREPAFRADGLREVDDLDLDLPDDFPGGPDVWGPPAGARNRWQQQVLPDDAHRDPPEEIPILEGSRWEPNLTGENINQWIARARLEVTQGIRPARAVADVSWGRSSRVDEF